MVQQKISCNLLRRFMVIGYDIILLCAVLFFATLIIMPFTSGKAVTRYNLVYQIYLLFCIYMYFAWQWTHGGQTLGMKAWHIKLTTCDGKRVNWKCASKRFLFATISWLVVGAGFFWAIFDNDKLTFHDRLSNSRLTIENSKLSEN